MDVFNFHLRWLVTMAKNPGFKAHAWHRAKQLESDESGLWVGIAEALKREMSGLEKPAASASPSPGKSL